MQTIEKLRSWLVARSGECQLVGNGFDQCLTLLDELERLQKDNGAKDAALKAWEAWEAKLLMDGSAWLSPTGCTIPQALFDEYVTGPQQLRATALQGAADV